MQLNKSKVIFLNPVICEKNFLLRAAVNSFALLKLWSLSLMPDASTTPKRYTQPFFKINLPESLQFREGLEQLPIKPPVEQTHSVGLPGFHFI
jgi:hypothetical protein